MLKLKKWIRKIKITKATSPVESAGVVKLSTNISVGFGGGN